MIDPFVGQISIVSFNFAPRGWAFCHGQILPIQQNTALFSLLGTTYGGDGRTTFALPDLRGRTPIGEGQGPRLSNRALGATGGAEKVALTVAQLPEHDHTATVVCSSSDSGVQSPAGAVSSRTIANSYSTEAPDGEMAAGSVKVDKTGSGIGHNNMPPFLTLNFIIALQGVFPPRD